MGCQTQSLFLDPFHVDALDAAEAVADVADPTTDASDVADTAYVSLSTVKPEIGYHRGESSGGRIEELEDFSSRELDRHSPNKIFMKKV